MPNTEKLERVAELKERIEGADALLLTEYRGLTVSEITELRRSLREGGASFAVVKNTLMQRAATEAGIDELVELLSGPSAVAFVSGDPVAAAKSIKAAAKQYPSLVLKGGYLDGQVLDATQATGLADLESREEMLSKIAGLMKSEMSKAARLFVSAQSRFVSLLEAYKEKVPGEEATDEVVSEEVAAEPEDASETVAAADEPAETTTEAEPSSEQSENEEE
jgi:large subunit ribosomal protein L10